MEILVNAFSGNGPAAGPEKPLPFSGGARLTHAHLSGSLYFYNVKEGFT